MKRNVFSCLLEEAGEVAVVTLVGRLLVSAITTTSKIVDTVDNTYPLINAVAFTQ